MMSVGGMIDQQRRTSSIEVEQQKPSGGATLDGSGRFCTRSQTEQIIPLQLHSYVRWKRLSQHFHLAHE